MRKYLAYYETEWPANIAELTAVENKPFVGYLKGEGVKFTIIPAPVEGPANNEIWYTTVDGNIFDIANAIQDTESLLSLSYTGPNIISNEFDSNKKVYIVTFDKEITHFGITPISNYNYMFNGPILFDVQNFGTGTPFISSIYLPQSILEINYCGYFYTTATEITIPNNVISIGGSAIMQNEELTKLIIPNTVTNIGTNAIATNPKLNYIEFCGTVNEWENINKETPWIVTCPLATYVQCTDGQVAL